MHSSVTDCVVALYPSPAGATESELHFESWSRLVRAEPGARDARARRRGADREPDVRAAGVRDRADRPLLHARRPDQGVAGRASPAARAWSRRSRRSSTSCREAVARVSQPPRSLEAPVERPSPSSRCSAPRGRRHAAAPALDFDVHVSRAERAARLRDRADGAGHDRAGPARLRRRDAREARRAVRRRRSAGPPPRAASSGTRPTRSCRPSPARRPSAGGAGELRHGGRRREVPRTGCPDGEVPLAFNFNGTVHYRGDDGRLQMSLVPWSCSAEFRLPVATWRDADRALLPAHAAGSRCSEETLAALQREKATRGLPTLDACVAELLEEAPGERRGARRLAALRGLRALPVHAGRDQERDADAVRDRLPAGLRGARSRRTYDHLELQCVVEGDGRGRRRGALPAAERRAPRGGAAADRAGGARRRSSSDDPASGRARLDR